jgi:hypothetical protein
LPTEWSATLARRTTSESAFRSDRLDVIGDRPASLGIGARDLVVSPD